MKKKALVINSGLKSTLQGYQTAAAENFNCRVDFSLPSYYISLSFKLSLTRVENYKRIEIKSRRVDFSLAFYPSYH